MTNKYINKQNNSIDDIDNVNNIELIVRRFSNHWTDI